MNDETAKILDRVQSQMKKGVLEYCILLILQHHEAYSADLLALLKENDLIVVEGTLYPLLNRLRKEELVTYAWVESTQGPPRKYYFITDKGREVLAQLSTAWGSLTGAVEQIQRQATLEAVPSSEVETPLEQVPDDQTSDEGAREQMIGKEESVNDLYKEV